MHQGTLGDTIFSQLAVTGWGVDPNTTNIPFTIIILQMAL